MNSNHSDSCNSSQPLPNLHRRTHVERSARQSYLPISDSQSRDTLIKLTQVIGDTRHGRPGLLHVSKSTLYRLIRIGRFPQPLKPFPGCRSSLWRLGDVLDAIRELAGPPYADGSESRRTETAGGATCR